MTRPSTCLLLLLGGLAAAHGSATAQTLEGFAAFPADTFAPGPTSGQLILAANGRLPPFEDKQPVQGISSVLAGSHGGFWVMADNGFGAKENSSDFVLRLYRIDPDFRTRPGAPGTVELKSHISLRDPDHKINFPIVADGAVYPGSSIPVATRREVGQIAAREAHSRCVAGIIRRRASTCGSVVCGSRSTQVVVTPAVRAAAGAGASGRERNPER